MKKSFFSRGSKQSQQKVGQWEIPQDFDFDKVPKHELLFEG